MNAWLLLVPPVAILALDLIAVTVHHRDRPERARDRKPARGVPHRGPGGMWRL